MNLEKIANVHDLIGHYLPRPLPDKVDVFWWSDFVQYLIKINPQAYLGTAAALSGVTFQDIIKLDAETILIEFIKNILEVRYMDFVKFMDGMSKHA